MSETCLKPSHFVGYWGCCQPPREFQSSGVTPAGLSWGVSGVVRSSHWPAGTIAALSAAGSRVADVWVQVRQEELIFARAALGRVPLYWTQQADRIWFASQLQLLLPLLSTPEVNLAGLYSYCCFSYVATPLTPVEGIHALSAGTELVWRYEAGEFKCQKSTLYSFQSAAEMIQDEAEALRQLKTLLKATIERNLKDLSAQPVGVSLSGGLDSSVVAALLVQAGVKVRGYTLDFGTAGLSEIPYAERVAEYLNIPLVKVDASPRRVQRAIAPTAKALDLPFGDGVTVPLYLLYQVASQEVSVIFNGENGDQLFAGWTNKPMIAASVYDRKADFTTQYLKTFHRLYGYEQQVFASAVYEKIRFLNPQEWVQAALDAKFSSDLLARLRRATLMLKGAQNIQPRATNLAFAHHLWVRSPFCDLPLSEWSFRVPGEFYLRAACEKYILKRAVEEWLPPEIVWREKRGMGVPLTQWCLTQLWTEVGRWLNPGILRSEGRFAPELGWQVSCGSLGGRIWGRRIGEILWLLLMWQVWRTQVLGETATGRSFVHPFWVPAAWLKQWVRVQDELS